MVFNRVCSLVPVSPAEAGASGTESLTVSQYSRQRLINVLGLPPMRVEVIKPGVDLEMFHPVPLEAQKVYQRKMGLNHPYLLFLGTPGKGKNLGRLLQAWMQVAAGFPQVELVIGGQSASNIRPARQFPGKVRWLGSIPEANLAALYSGGLALILPSLGEGFGLTVLEAMACGLPVVAAKAGALPEVVGEAGLWIDPLNVDSLETAICQIIGDASLRMELRERGLAQCEQFNWDQAARAVNQTMMELQNNRI